MVAEAADRPSYSGPGIAQRLKELGLKELAARVPGPGSEGEGRNRKPTG